MWPFGTKNKNTDTENAPNINEKDFDWSPLWQDAPASNFWKYVPIISVIFELIILIILIFRK